MKKAPMSKRELRLMAEVKRLKKRIEENNILMHEVAVKIEDIEAARLALEESRQTQVK
jgi:predicted outer membrane protein